MKKLLFLGVGLLVAASAFCQAGSNEYSTAIFHHISTVYGNISANAKDTFVLRRVETGILTEGQNSLYSSIQRKLFRGNSYSVAAFTDDRVKTFDLNCYKKNTTTNKWDLVKSETAAGTAKKDPLMGESKYLTVAVDEDGTYLFEITASKNTDNSTARFAMMVYSKAQSLNNPPPPPPDASTFFSIDGLDYCEYDSVNRNFNNCTSRPGEASLFELNAGKTMFTHTTSSMTSHYYVQSKRLDTQYNLYTYEVVSDVGNRYIFYVPSTNTGNLSIFKEAGNKSYMIKHHIRRSWTGAQ